ncbi:hypothetical protein GGTG_09967 [Gaeumannomyces tritici R3-111a-1]|uniref:Uncharacterized protein n=1 Tax=Gaeumannomyces tritici (strain R3-111a-1) TaxID=644352 RepID=J3P8Y2_GAET3|nr:hypothetical protein GGTG_09967 [Gaeumannomyces tritici R3-111a-1]EJT73117.1 hypothetical protein GGTG_09967 [Gaeumannomyces tritici R3-111a-1]
MLFRRLPVPLSAPFISRNYRGFATTAANHNLLGLAALSKDSDNNLYFNALVKKTAIEDAADQMAPSELGAWSAYTDGRLILPKVDWNGAPSRARAPISDQSLETAQSYAEALSRLYSGMATVPDSAAGNVSSEKKDKPPLVRLSPSQAAWFVREYKLETTLVKAVGRIIRVEKSMYKVLQVVSQAAAKSEKDGDKMD